MSIQSKFIQFRIKDYRIDIGSDPDLIIIEQINLLQYYLLLTYYLTTT